MNCFTSTLSRAAARARKLCIVAAIASFQCLYAADPPLPDYSKGAATFPKFWRGFEWRPVPRPNLANGFRLLDSIREGRLEISLARLVPLVEENSLDVLAARYNVHIAETDVLRAQSGQAARGAPGVALPQELFASALGAGTGAALTANTGGTGPAAISAAARQLVVGERGTFDPDVQVTFSFDHASSPLNTSIVAGIPTVVTPSTDILTRFEKEFSTGFSFSLSYNSQRQTSTQLGLLYNPALTSRLSLTWNQPLLNGFGFAVNRRFINIANNDVQISRELFRQQVTAALVNTQDAYWDLVAARKSVESASEALAATQRLYQDSLRQLEFGVVAALDVLQAQSAVAASRRDLIIAQTSQQMKELDLKALLSKNVDVLSDVELVTLDPLPEPEAADIPVYEEALAAALRNRSELRQTDLNMQNQRITEKYTRNSLLPVFSVFGTYASSTLVSAAGPLIQQVWLTVPYPEYAVGFSFTIPLRNRSAQADEVRAKLELSQAESALERTRSQIGLDVRTALTTLVQAKSQLAAARAAMQSSQQALDAEQLKLQYGVSTPYRVILVQRDLVAAQFQQLQAHANYVKARIQMERVMGMTLQRNNVSVDEALRGGR
jgi:outer membrane protein TolC